MVGDDLMTHVSHVMQFRGAEFLDPFFRTFPGHHEEHENPQIAMFKIMFLVFFSYFGLFGE